MIQQIPGNGDRIQLLRIFRRYVSPATSVEMLKRKTDTEEICLAFGPLFRDIDLIRNNMKTKKYDTVLSALLYEHKDRGKLGYELTSKFFDWFETKFARMGFVADGPRGAGKDIELSSVIPGYDERCPTDILISKDSVPLVAGFARYDSDRGGSQEDDRTGGNRSKILEILRHAQKHNVPLKILFLNDGPGLLLGSMWRDYAELESIDPSRVLVVTLKMLNERLTKKWIQGF